MSEALISDIGLLRDKNQDYITKAINTNNDILYILCDGMGGYKGGEVASCKSASILKKYFEKTSFVDANEAKEWLTNTIEQVNAEIKDLATHNSELSKMGTTLICLLITKDYKMFASVGDSRLYSYSKKELKQISEDQTFVNALLKAGYIDKKEAEIHPNKAY